MLEINVVGKIAKIYPIDVIANLKLNFVYSVNPNRGKSPLISLHFLARTYTYLSLFSLPIRPLKFQANTSNSDTSVTFRRYMRSVCVQEFSHF
jgi:hypothetical protein